MVEETARVLPFWRRQLQTVTATPARRRVAAAAAMAAGVLLAVGLWMSRPDGLQPGGGEVAQSLPSPSPTQSPVDRTETSPLVRSSPAVSPGTGPAAAQTGGQGPDRTPAPSPSPAPVLQRIVIQLALATRGDGEARHEIPAGTGEVELQLAVAGEPFESFRFVVRDAAGAEVAQEKLSAHVVDEVPTVSLIVPAKLLPDGLYEVEVAGLNDGAEPEPIYVIRELEVVRTQ